MRKSILMSIWTVVFLGIIALVVPAQSLLDNEFYKKAKDLLAQSQAELQTGDYDAAASLAAEARDNLAKSDDYVATMLFIYRANGWLSQANDRVAYAQSIKADTNYKDAYEKAVADVEAARIALDAKEYQNSIDLSKSALAFLQNIAPQAAVAEAPEPAAPAPEPAAPALEPVAQPLSLPEYYTVRLLLPLRDCFWRIAAYPFVYNNPWKWRLLYEANKSVLGDPNNPDLIEVGERFIIPSLNGENREGDYDPQNEYPALSSR